MFQQITLFHKHVKSTVCSVSESNFICTVNRYHIDIPIYFPFFYYNSCTVDGLPLNEFRVLSEKAAATPEYRDEKNRRVEFATPTFNVLNALEQMGYRVVTSGAFVTGHNKFDQREFVWTLHRSTSEMECQ